MRTKMEKEKEKYSEEKDSEFEEDSEGIEVERNKNKVGGQGQQGGKKEGSLQGLDLKFHQLKEFVEKMPIKYKNPVNIGTTHPDIEVPQLEESVTGERLLELAGNTIRKMKNHKRLKKNWNKQDLTILLWVTDKYNHLHNKTVQNYKQDDWNHVAEFVPGKSGSQCMFKWLGLKKHHLTEHPWTLDQQMDLKKLVQQKGQASWPQISQELYVIGNGRRTFRSAKQCRQHWTCYVNPNLKKGLWRPQQDLELLNQFMKLGKKWAQISKVLNGRTQNAIKNRFNLLMQKQGQLKGNPNPAHRRDYAIKIIQQIQSTYNIPSRPLPLQQMKTAQKKQPLKFQQIKFFDNQPNQSISFPQRNHRLYSDSPLPPLQFPQIQVKVQNNEQSIFKKVKFCKVSLQGLMEMQGVIPAVFDRDTFQIFVDNGMNVDLLNQL